MEWKKVTHEMTCCRAEDSTSISSSLLPSSPSDFHYSMAGTSECSTKQERSRPLFPLLWQ